MNPLSKLSVIVLSLLAAGSVHAQLTILSDARSVSVTGWVTDENGNISQSYSQSKTPSAPFGAFAGNAGGNANGPFYYDTIYSGSSAVQNSSLSSSQLSFSGSVGAFQAYPAPAGHLYADAYSLFSVSFSVSTPTHFSLTDNQHNWAGDAGESLTLSSASGGTIVSGPQFNPSGPGIDEYSGMLEPDQIYTLLISLQTQDYFQSDVSQGFDVAFNVPAVLSVPEPSSNLLLGAGGIMTGLVALWRKRRAKS